MGAAAGVTVTRRGAKLHYYIELAISGLRRERIITLEFLACIALGTAATITTFTLLYFLSSNPIPARSGVLFVALLDSSTELDHLPDGRSPDQLNYTDAIYLMQNAPVRRHAMMVGGSVVLFPSSQAEPAPTSARFTTNEFFNLFDVPFAYGSGWSRGDDERRARVAVISSELNRTLFGGASSIGKQITLDGASFLVVGVLQEWRPAPRYYDLNTGPYAKAEDIYLPFATARDLQLSLRGKVDCWNGAGPNRLEDSDCSWLQYWAELPDAPARQRFSDFLHAYVHDRAKARGATALAEPEVLGLMQWLEQKKVVPAEVKLQAWFALGFLVICIVNAVSLMLVKFNSRVREYSIRRALGATRADIALECLAESSLMGLIGGALALALAAFALHVVHQQPWAYADLAQLDPAIGVIALLSAIVVALISGVLPAWTVSQIPPASILRSE